MFSIIFSLTHKVLDVLLCCDISQLSRPSHDIIMGIVDLTIFKALVELTINYFNYNYRHYKRQQTFYRMWFKCKVDCNKYSLRV